MIIKIAGKTQQGCTHRGAPPSYRPGGPGSELYDRANRPSFSQFLIAEEFAGDRFVVYFDAA
ncbi:MAG: hypothetical protein JO260_02305 [Acidobacteria bacterium]|nr:hypothetical protein [Acidobacteriota bacterium]